MCGAVAHSARRFRETLRLAKRGRARGDERKRSPSTPPRATLASASRASHASREGSDTRVLASANTRYRRRGRGARASGRDAAPPRDGDASGRPRPRRHRNPPARRADVVVALPVRRGRDAAAHGAERQLRLRAAHAERVRPGRVIVRRVGGEHGVSGGAGLRAGDALRYDRLRRRRRRRRERPTPTDVAAETPGHDRDAARERRTKRHHADADAVVRRHDAVVRPVRHAPVVVHARDADVVDVFARNADARAVVQRPDDVVRRQHGVRGELGDVDADVARLRGDDPGERRRVGERRRRRREFTNLQRRGGERRRDTRHRPGRGDDDDVHDQR
eukprot:31408-Pelagococcus_subviridis.AAC.22